MKALPDPSLPWPIPLEAVALIAEAEGLRLHAYRCPAGVATIGFGHVGPEVVIGKTVWTREQADREFCNDLTEFTSGVRAKCTVTPTANQLGALVSLAFNVGQAGFAGSTVLKKHNASDWQSASRAFGLWNKARVNGQLIELAGLTARRAAEAALYLKPEVDAPALDMPQAVESESSMAASPINRGGIAAAGTGVIAILTEAGASLGGLREPLGAARDFMASTLGVPPSWILPLMLVGVGLAVMYWRAKQRAGGWA